MRVAKNHNTSRLVKAARGEIPCDLTIKNIQLVNVLTGEIYPSSVGILDGIIVQVGDEEKLPSKQVIDGHNNYLVPGFIDTHMHVESTMMVPENFGKAAVVWGTTTAITDPHEIANVAGIVGVKYMLESARRSPLRIYTLAPSCVPAVPAVESAGASFMKEEIQELLKNDEVIGIAEVMDYLGVINNDKRMHDIIAAGQEANGFIQGHAPYVRGNELSAYLCGGPISDHEARIADELIEKLRKGMHVNIKSSSLSDTVQEFLNGIKSVPVRNLVSLCTDDVHAADLLNTGHINHIVNECIKGGITPIEAITFGTINAARELHFDDLGAIAPGYVADLQLVSDLNFNTRPICVFVEGELISNNKATVATIPNVNTVKIPQISSPNDFLIHVDDPNEQQLVFSASRQNMIPGQKAIYRKFPEENGVVVIDDKEKYQFLSIVDRYGSGDITTVVCSDFNLHCGCIASTISHDSHNMTLVYTNPKDAFVTAKELERVGGGMCFVENGEVKYTLPLPVGGLMSPLPAAEIAKKIDNMNEWVSYASDSPILLAIAILALPVRPGIIITNKGVIRGDDLQFIPLKLNI